MSLRSSFVKMHYILDRCLMKSKKKEAVFHELCQEHNSGDKFFFLDSCISFSESNVICFYVIKIPKFLGGEKTIMISETRRQVQGTVGHRLLGKNNNKSNHSTTHTHTHLWEGTTGENKACRTPNRNIQDGKSNLGHCFSANF